MEREIEMDGARWRVIPLPEEAERSEADGWHLQRVRFEPIEAPDLVPRETWLRLEEDIPADDVLDQYEHEQLVEAYLVAEEVGPGPGEAPG